MRLLRLSGLATVLALAGGGIAPATGAPLDAPACEQLQAKLDTLRSEGAAADMARGPEWARANLPPDRLQRIGTLLETEEQLNFRCGKARINLPTTIEGGEEELPAPGEASVEGKTVVLPQKSPAPPKRPATAAATATTVPKAPAPKAPVAKAPVKKQSAAQPEARPGAQPGAQPGESKPAAKMPAPPAKASEKAAKPAVVGTEPGKAPPVKKKAPPKSDDAYRPPPRRAPATEDGGAAFAPKQ